MVERVSRAVPVMNGLRRLVVCCAVLLGGCAADYIVRPVPDAISSAPEGDPGLPAVTAEPARYEGRSVRWGGTIMARDSHDGTTVLRVLARALDGSGQPYARGTVLGEFALRSGEVTASIEAGADITVAGTVSGSVEAGEGAHRVPVVDPATLHAWGVQPAYDYYPYGGGPYYIHPSDYPHRYRRHGYGYYPGYYPYYGPYLHYRYGFGY